MCEYCESLTTPMGPNVNYKGVGMSKEFVTINGVILIRKIYDLIKRNKLVATKDNEVEHNGLRSKCTLVYFGIDSDVAEYCIHRPEVIVDGKEVEASYYIVVNACMIRTYEELIQLEEARNKDMEDGKWHYAIKAGVSD